MPEQLQQLQGTEVVGQATVGGEVVDQGETAADAVQSEVGSRFAAELAAAALLPGRDPHDGHDRVLEQKMTAAQGRGTTKSVAR